MQQVVVARDKAMQEMRSKFSRNRQILATNWEQAESEVRRLDEIYHDTVDRMVMSFASIPDLSQQYAGLKQLIANLQLMRVSQQTQENTDKDKKVVANSNKITNTMMSRSLIKNYTTKDPLIIPALTRALMLCGDVEEHPGPARFVISTLVTLKVLIMSSFQDGW